MLMDLRAYVEEQWADDDFGVLKEDFKNAFNLVSCLEILLYCAEYFPELLTWVNWCCYGQHLIMWHSRSV